MKALGYSEVELGGPPYSTMEPKELRRQLTRLGLTVPAMHVSMEELEADPSKLFGQARTLGVKYVVLPWTNPERRSTIAQCQATAAQFTRFGKAAKAEGLTFAYHNHSFEFVAIDGKLPFDIFFGESDPELVKIELDLFWATKAGANISAIFDRYYGRIPLCHVKDLKIDGSMTEVGSGTIEFATLFAMSPQAGLLHYFVEHDAPPYPYWPSVASSASYLKQLRF